MLQLVDLMGRLVVSPSSAETTLFQEILKVIAQQFLPKGSCAAEPYFFSGKRLPAGVPIQHLPLIDVFCDEEEEKIRALSAPH